jgi:hypothetical protein
MLSETRDLAYKRRSRYRPIEVLTAEVNAGSLHARAKLLDVCRLDRSMNRTAFTAVRSSMT